MALLFLLLLPLRSWHTHLGELEPDERNRESEEKAGTPCRPFDIIHMGHNEISVLSPPPPKDHPQLQQHEKRETQGEL